MLAIDRLTVDIQNSNTCLVDERKSLQVLLLGYS